MGYRSERKKSTKTSKYDITKVETSWEKNGKKMGKSWKQIQKLETNVSIFKSWKHHGKKMGKSWKHIFPFSKVETCLETVQSCPKRRKFTVRNAKSRLKHQNMTLQKWKHHGKKMGKKWEK